MYEMNLGLLDTNTTRLLSQCRHIVLLREIPSHRAQRSCCPPIPNCAVRTRSRSSSISPFVPDGLIIRTLTPRTFQPSAPWSPSRASSSPLRSLRLHSAGSAIRDPPPGECSEWALRRCHCGRIGVQKRLSRTRPGFEVGGVKVAGRKAGERHTTQLEVFQAFRPPGSELAG
jgi:hypothetical protein